MLKKYWKYILPVLLLLAAGIFFFKWWGRSIAAWQFVPSSAVAVLSSEHLQDSTFVATEAKIDLKTLPIVETAARNLSILNWFTTDSEQLFTFLHKKNITYSYHLRSGEEARLVLYIPLAGENEAEWLSNPRRSDVRVLHHKFQDQEITDINSTSSEALFSYFIKDNYLIISKHGDLVEEVVRQLNAGLKKLILHSKFEYTSDESYDLNLYVEKKLLNSTVFQSKNYPSNLNNFVDLFPDYQDYHLQIDDNSAIRLKSDGCESSENYVTKWLKENGGTPFKNHEHVSQQTSYMFRIGANDKNLFKENFAKWRKKYQHSAWSKVEYYLPQESDKLVTNIGSEIIFCQLEENSSITNGKLLLSRFDNYDQVRPLLDRLAHLSTPESNVAVDKFQGYDLYSIAIPELPTGIFGPLFSGFNRTYISYVAPYLVLSNDSQALRNYLTDYENQLTWKQSPEHDSLLSMPDSKAQLALVVNVRKARSNSKPDQFNPDFISKIESFVFECQLDGDRSTPTLTLLPKKRKTSQKVLNRTFLNVNVEWPVLYDSVMAALQNSIDGNAEILITDKSGKLLKVSNLKSGKTQALTPLDGGIATMSFKSDFLNIGRQQSILATRSSVYAIDEDEKGIVTPFRAKLPNSSPITALYRIEAASEGGNRFVIKNKSEELFVWNNASQSPRKINRFTKLESVREPVVALNQLGKKLFVITQQNGKILLLREDGTTAPGFPVDLLTRIEGGFGWSQNATTSQIELVGITALGELTAIDLVGKINKRQQLLRPEAQSRFRTLFDSNSLDWIMIRSTDTKIAILNKEGKDLFEIINLKPKSEINYHFFGIDNRFISIRSTDGFATIFDLSGRRLGDKPIPSDKPIRLAYQAAFYKLLIFSHYENKIQTWSIKLR